MVEVVAKLQTHSSDVQRMYGLYMLKVWEEMYATKVVKSVVIEVAKTNETTVHCSDFA